MRKIIGTTIAVGALLCTSTPALAVGTGGAVIANGHIYNADGTPFPRGTVVDLAALPPSVGVDDQNEGDSSSGTMLTFTTIQDDTGMYVMRILNTDGLRRYASPDGYVNLELFSISPTGDIASFNITRDVNARAGTSPGDADSLNVTDPESAATDSEDGTSPFSATRIDAQPAGTDQGVEGARISSAANTAAALTSTPSFSDCYDTLTKKYAKVNVVVGAAYVTTGDGGQAFTYSNGSSSHLGTAFSATGAKGSFKGSGSGGIEVDGSNDSSTNFGEVDGVHSYRYQEYFSYGKYRRACANAPGGSPTNFIGYIIKPIKFVAPSTRLSSSAPPATHCGTLAFNTSFTKKATHATTYSAGVDLAVAQGGLSVSARSGYTSSIAATLYNKSKSKNHPICGSKGLPADGPGRLVLKP